MLYTYKNWKKLVYVEQISHLAHETISEFLWYIIKKIHKNRLFLHLIGHKSKDVNIYIRNKNYLI